MNNLTHRPFDPGIYKTRLSTVEKYLSQTKNRSQTRCGILPYIILNEKYYICFGKDHKSGDYTDFGGGVHKGEEPLQCAIREFSEESRGVFGKISIEDLQGCTCMYNKKMLIVIINIFAKSNLGSPLDLIKNSLSDFRSMSYIPEDHRSDPKYNEIKAISWISEDIIKDVFIDNGYSIKVYTRVRKFLRSCKEFSTSLESIKRSI